MWTAQPLQGQLRRHLDQSLDELRAGVAGLVHLAVDEFQDVSPITAQPIGQLGPEWICSRGSEAGATRLKELQLMWPGNEIKLKLWIYMVPDNYKDILILKLRPSAGWISDKSQQSHFNS